MVAESDKARARASEQATDWLILLQEEPDDADLRRRFEAWLAGSPLHAEAWAATERVAGILERMPPVPIGRRRRKPYRRSLGIAAVAVAASIAVFCAPAIWSRLRADHVTGTAETATVVLPDGGSVVLAPESAIRVSYGTAQRRVELLSGEAFFRVMHHAARPFQVRVGNVETTDLGTAFDVRREADGAVVSVEDGSVQVAYRAAPLPVVERLNAGQTVHVPWTGMAVRGVEAPGEIAAWRHRQLIAEDEALREVVDRLRPYFAGKIIVTSAALGNRPVTGVYNLSDPVQALRGIAEAQGATVRRITPWLLVVSGG